MEEPRQLLVRRQSPRPAVDHEEDRVGFLERGARLSLHGRRQPGVGPGVETGRVDEQYRAPLDIDLLRDPVAGDARAIGHQRPAAAGVPVEQRRLPDIGTADDRHDRKLSGTRHGRARKRRCRVPRARREAKPPDPA